MEVDGIEIARRHSFVRAAALLLVAAIAATGPGAHAGLSDPTLNTSRENALEIRLDVPTSTASDPLADTSGAETPAVEATPAQAPWTDLPDLQVPIFDNRIGLNYTMGGNDGTAVSDEMWWYRESTGEWTPEFGLPRPRQAPAVGRNRYNEMVMAGGWGENGEPTATAHYYDDGSTEWVYDLEEMPSARAAAGYASFTDEGALYVIGGCTTAECEPASDSVFLLDDWYGEWSVVADYPFPVAFPSCGAWKERIYCTGGHDDTGGISDSYVYDRSTDRWSELPDPPTDSWGAAHAMVDGVLVVNGGVQGGAVTNNTFGYDVKAGAWVDLPDSGAARYRGAAGCVRQGAEGRQLIAVGGLDGTDAPLGRAEALPGITDCDNGEGVPAVSRYAGENRYGTAAKIAGLHEAPADTVFLTTGQSFPDALAASALAGSLDAPLLLTSSERLPDETRAQLERLTPQDVIAVGGTGAVTDDMLEVVEEASGGGSVRRLAGTDRYGTAAAVAAEFETADTVFIATGADFPDALAGSALAGTLDVPLMLARTNRLPDSTRAQLERLEPERIVVLGGTGVISSSVADELDRYGEVDRIAGGDRWETAALVAAEFDDAEPVGVASGLNWPDAVAGAARAGSVDAPVILVDPARIPDASRSQLRRLGPLAFEIYGGRGAVSRDVFLDLRALYD
ncbi:MAG: cell wall-binding repeat-containing protein [Ornithinimicrobium sp.]